MINVPFLESYFRLGNGSLHPAHAAAMFLVLVLTLLCGVSRKQAGFTLVVLNQMIHWLGQNDEQSVNTTTLPRDPRTLLQYFDLNPRLRSYTCCPSCFALYSDSAPAPDNCTNQKATDEPPCGASLFRTKVIRGRSFRRPVRKYVHQVRYEALSCHIVIRMVPLGDETLDCTVVIPP